MYFISSAKTANSQLWSAVSRPLRKYALWLCGSGRIRTVQPITCVCVSLYVQYLVPYRIPARPSPQTPSPCTYRYSTVHPSKICLYCTITIFYYTLLHAREMGNDCTYISTCTYVLTYESRCNLIMYCALFHVNNEVGIFYIPLKSRKSLHKILHDSS